MSKTYAITEIVGTSPDGVTEAIESAIGTASRSLRNLDWFEVVSVRGAISDNRVTEYQVSMKVGFRYEDEG
jgi:flavin-binding protein dodecin